MKPWKLGCAVIGMLLAFLFTPAMYSYMNNAPLTPPQFFDSVLWAFGGACLGFGVSSLLFRFFSHDLSENFFRWLFVGCGWLAVVAVRLWAAPRNTEDKQFIFNLFERWDGLLTLGVMVLAGIVGFVLDAIRHKIWKMRL